MHDDHIKSNDAVKMYHVSILDWTGPGFVKVNPFLMMIEIKINKGYTNEIML